MNRDELVTHLIDSCAESGYEMLEWLHDRVDLTKDDVMGSYGILSSTLRACVLRQKQGSLRFFRTLGLADEIRTIKRDQVFDDEDEDDHS